MAKIFVVLFLSCFVASVHPQLLPDLSSLFGAIAPVTSGLTSGVTSAVNPQAALTQGLQTATGLLNTVTSAITPTGILNGLTNALLPQTQILTDLTKQLTGTNAADCLKLIGNGFKDAATGGSKSFTNCIDPFIKQATQYQTAVTDISKNMTTLTTKSSVDTFNCFIESLKTLNFAQSVKCISDAVAEVTNFIQATSQRVQNLVNDSRNLVLQLPSCSTKALLSSTQTANALLQNIVGCASGKGVNTTLPTLPGVPDLTSIVSDGLNSLGQASSMLTGAGNPLASATSLLNSATQSVSSLTPPAINNAIGKALTPALDTITKAVTAATASNNPDFKVCAATAQAASLKILPAATANTVKCTASIGTASAALTAKIAALNAANTAKITASFTATTTSCSIASMGFNPGNVLVCLQKALSELNGYVTSSLSSGQQLLDSSTNVLSQSTQCLGSASEIAVQTADNVVTAMTDCLSGKGISLNLGTVLG